MEESVKVFVLGTYHFGNCGGHLVNIDVKDITSDEKQKEIGEVIEKLLKFKPNKIAVEAREDKSQELNNAYFDYCIGKSLENNKVISHRNEIVQLGFRLGHMLKHEKIFPVDYPVDLPDDYLDYAEKKCSELYAKFIKELNDYGDYVKEFLSSHTVCECLKYFNNPTRISKEHGDLYLHMAQVGAGDTYYGVNMLTEWYRRNLYILGNLQKIAEPGDRILLIYGAGHCKILQEFVKEYNAFELVDALDYL